jgi:D-alanyl-D-alanine dipeptidase
MDKFIGGLFLVITITSCKHQNSSSSDTLTMSEPADTSYVYLVDFSNDFILDLRYATENNFLNDAVYPCAECVLAYETIKGLIKANNLFMQQGFRIKIFDCYRPRSVQYKMWEILPDNQYVANPAGKGSAHNRGLAVDLTLVNLAGEELDMGTGFDHFGVEAHHAYAELPDTVLQNRLFLKGIMESAGFSAISSEWWHYYLITDNDYAPADFPLCREE